MSQANSAVNESVQAAIQSTLQVALQVTIETTPNPATMKFLFSGNISEKTYEFLNSMEAQISPLANKLFGFPWTSSVFIGQNFVTVSKQDWVDWDVLAEPLAGLIREHLQSGQAVVYDLPESTGDDDISENDSPIIKQIKRILIAEIKPIVALDGGDIAFSSYQNGILAIQMKGACSGCPSSTATLKDGIEVRFKELLPEIKEVISV